ncbi:MAG TPA: hypothetical protein DIC32_00840 [Acinetobacter radioresistens]|uniref:LamG domain-containing protein n=1 Tax=Acinetobacter radioresistens TaxID=40216 RepID=A0A3D3FX36_ACIRA|nr:hypothetical protein [Acinetobacter radioresistens]
MTNRLELNWKLDGLIDEQRYYCSETQFAAETKPVPKFVLANDVRTYVDTAVETGKTYYIAVGSVKNGVEKLSNVASIYTGDVYRANVKALLHFDGANGSTSINDDTGRIWTSSVATIDTSTYAFGGASVYFNGTSSYITTAYSTDFELETSDFTIELYLNPTSDIQGTILTNRDSGIRGWLLRREVGGALGFYYIGSSGSSLVTASSAIPLNTWTHIAVTRLGTTLRIFINGVLVSSLSNLVQSLPSLKALSIGSTRGDGSFYRYFKGNMDELRITKGVARYTQDFTPQAHPFMY